MSLLSLAPRSFLLSVLVLALLASPVAAQDDSEDADIELEETSVPALDAELLAALDSVGLADEWSSAGTRDPRSALVEVEGSGIEATRLQLIDDATELVELRQRTSELIELIGQFDELEQQVAEEVQFAEAELAVAAISSGVVEDALSDAVVARYVHGEPDPSITEDPQDTYDTATQVVLVDVAVEDLSARLDHLEAEMQLQSADVAVLLDAQAANAATRLETETELDEITPRWQELEVTVPNSMSSLRDQRLGAPVVGLGLTLVTLDAYLHGEAMTAERHPDCQVRWQAIAAIGRVESNHGRDRGGYVRGDGSLTTPFFGIVLTGEDEINAEVLDTDGGALDGDAEYDRAVGPFQFLPGSWRSDGIDGNGDGIADPQNLYDGAASAGNYLCRRTPYLGDDASLRRGFLTYNFLAEYADLVTQYMLTYDEYVVPTAPEDG